MQSARQPLHIHPIFHLCYQASLLMSSIQPRIGFLTGQLGLGGAEKQLYLLAKGLIQEGWHVFVITLNPDREDYWEGPFHELGIRLYKVPVSWNRLKRIYQVAIALNKEKPQVIHSWSFHANFYAAAAGFLAHVPVRLGSERANPRYSLNALGVSLHKLNLIGLDGLLTNSERTAIFLSQYFPHLNVYVVPNGIPSLERFMSCSESRQLFGLPMDARIIGAVGSLVPVKNFGALIGAAARLSLDESNIYFVLIGDGPLMDVLKQQVADLLPPGRFLFLGAIPNAARFLSAFDLFCMPSYQEGMPNVLMEACVAELPVVATEVGDASKIIEHGVNGFLVPPNDIEALSDRIHQLLVSPELRALMGKAGREKMQREFSIDTMVNRMINIYRSLQESYQQSREYSRDHQ